MIKYNFGIDCDLSWEKFLCLEVNSVKMYKQDFTDFSELFYFIEHNKKHITNLLFDGYEYVVENGLLHNLYGPAKIRYEDPNDHKIFHGTSKWFFIYGELVMCKDKVGRGCSNKKEFEGDIYFYNEITNKKSGRDIETGIYYRRKEGVDYIKNHIDLKKLREKDIRKKKLEKLNNV